MLKHVLDISCKWWLLNLDSRIFILTSTRHFPLEDNIWAYSKRCYCKRNWLCKELATISWMFYGIIKGTTALVWWFESWHTSEVVVCSNFNVSVVPTNIVHPTMVGGVSSLVVWVSTRSLVEEMICRFSLRHLVWRSTSKYRKVFTLQRGGYFYYTSLCPMVICLVKKMNSLFGD